MNTGRVWGFVVAAITIGVAWVAPLPAQAQLALGCSCPAGFTPLSGTTCSKGLKGGGATTAAAICSGAGPAAAVVGRVAAAQQQLSFWGISQMLQQKRDQLQRQSSAPATDTGMISGYAPFDADDSKPIVQKNNPLSGLYTGSAPANTSTPVYGVWVQSMGDWEHDNALNAADVARTTGTYAAQGGVDRTWRHLLSPDDAVVTGIVASFTSSHVGFDAMPATLQLSGPGIGTYLQYVKGGFSGDLTTKFDFLRLNEDYAGIAPNNSLGVVNAGLSGNIHYKVTGAHDNFIEPTAGFSLTHTGFDSGAAALGLADAYTLRVQAGARAGTTWDIGHGVTVDTALRALAYDDVVAQGTGIAGDTGIAAVISPTDQGLVRGEFDPELCFNFPHDYSVSLSGQVRFGQAMVGGSANVNLRKQF
jgi:hypothetical protein